MSYNDLDNNGFADDNGANEANLVLGWLDGLLWENAIDGNHGLNNGIQYDSGWVNDAAHNLLGAYGVDTLNNVVWAVLDHNSRFSVIAQEVSAGPEPSSVVLAALGLVGLSFLAGRRRKGR